VQDGQQSAFNALVPGEDGLQSGIHGNNSNSVFANTQTPSFPRRRESSWLNNPREAGQNQNIVRFAVCLS